MAGLIRGLRAVSSLCPCLFVRAAGQIPEDHETVPFLVLPVIFHLLVLSYLYAYRKTDGAVVAVALFSCKSGYNGSPPAASPTRTDRLACPSFCQ